MQVSLKSDSPQKFVRTPIATGVMLAVASPALFAQETAIEEIVTTAQKREQSLQDVPISVQLLGNQQISELNLTNFKDYTQMLPSVAMTPTLSSGSSFNLVYMRGIATAGDGQATTSLPSVGMYLDELSMTTIQGNIDVHMYDIARVEALAGPQGTLYGASSQAGTIRIITNKPELGQFSSSVSAGASSVSDGGTGYTVEGYVNAPIGDNAAIRLVGWHRDDPGWIDNKQGTRVFTGVEDPATCAAAGVPCSADDITWDNSSTAKDDYNTLVTTGARAALRVDLGENWTVTPTVMFQNSESRGAWGDDINDVTASGKYAVTNFSNEGFDDEWSMIGLTIEGSIGNFDVVYAGSYLDREFQGSQDYSDYSYWYDNTYTTGYYADLHFQATGPRAIPNQFVPDYFDPADVGTNSMVGARYTNDDVYTKNNHELRISSDPDKRVRGLLGVFLQKQFHDFEQHWKVDGGLAPVMEMNQGTDPRFDDTVYLNSMYRTDRDFAVFGSLSFDITDNLELTVGTRFFEPEVHVIGFFGFGLGFTPIWSSNGENRCNLQQGDPGWTPNFNGQEDWKDKPCLNVDKRLEESDNVSRVNLTWNVSGDNMVYFTWSEGYRPGGVQRNPFAGEFLSDFLTNIEFGWKTRWADNRLQFNGALFTQEWEDFQVSFTGDNAITAVNNGPSATVNGLEADLLWLATDNLRISASAAFYDSTLDDDYCNFSAGVCTEVLAPKGTQLPVTADFKGNLVARYHMDIGSFDSYIQGAFVHEGKRSSDMDQSANAIIGDLPAYTTLDLAAGFGKDNWKVDVFVSNATGADEPLYYSAQCIAETCGAQIYGVRIRPRTIAARLTMDFN
ncbi:MAG: TonB-dependent receptor [Woeseiaceae bacterium]|nr:TonB-dependent receptor [Woeseiaceae bacterium]